MKHCVLYSCTIVKCIRSRGFTSSPTRSRAKESYRWTFKSLHLLQTSKQCSMCPLVHCSFSLRMRDHINANTGEPVHLPNYPVEGGAELQKFRGVVQPGVMTRCCVSHAHSCHVQCFDIKPERVFARERVAKHPHRDRNIPWFDLALFR